MSVQQYNIRPVAQRIYFCSLIDYVFEMLLPARFLRSGQVMYNIPVFILIAFFLWKEIVTHMGLYRYIQIQREIISIQVIDLDSIFESRMVSMRVI